MDATISRKGPPAENVLLAYTEQLGSDAPGYRAIVFHLSRVGAAVRDEKHFRIATNMLMELVDRFTGRLFILRSRDIVTICKGLTAKAINEFLDAFIYLLGTDQSSHGNVRPDLYTVYDLEIGYHQFLAVVRDLQTKEAKLLEKRSRADSRERSFHRKVSDLIDNIAGIDLSNAVQRQTIWALEPGKKPQPKFDEVYFSIHRLQKVLEVDFDLTKNHQLFRYLTESLDRFLLTKLGWEQFGVSRPVSLNINLRTLYSPEFLKFDNERASGWRGRTIFELQVSDIWSDLSAYLTIADLVKQRGYFRCLDGVKYDALPCLNLQNLKIDLVKLTWDDALLQLENATIERVRQSLHEFGPRRTILARCDKLEAVQFGQSLGIRLFQGWHLDRFVEIK